MPNRGIKCRCPLCRTGVFHALTDAEGTYRLLDLPPATDYAVTAEKPGFSKFERKGVSVCAGLNIELDIDLAVGGVNQTVEVTAGDVPLLETVSTEQAVNVSGEMVRSLPLTGRREWSDTLQLTPGNSECLHRCLRRPSVLCARQ